MPTSAGENTRAKASWLSRPKAAAAARAIPAAVAHPAPLSTDAAKALASKPKLVARQSMPTCYQTYERKFGQCGGGDSACQLKVGDDWDVCEATGLWPA